MRALRFFAVILVFGAVSAAWWILGGAMWVRTSDLEEQFSREIRNQWGPERLVQTSPYVATRAEGRRDDPNAVAPSGSRITADISHADRYKGLLWFSTFTVSFDATYTFAPAGDGVMGVFIFDLPADINGCDNLLVELDGEPQNIPAGQIATGRISLSLDRSQANEVHVRYEANGQDIWLYVPGDAVSVSSGRSHRDESNVIEAWQGLVSLLDFSLTVNTNFRDIDYPLGTRSPSRPAAADNGGMTAEWAFQNAVTNQAMGLVMPKRANAGPIVTRMSFFAPVSLFFFFTVLLAVVMLKKIPLHPMHYLFIAAGFFAFHILLAYLVDKISIQTAFWICAAVSMLLVVSYMRLVADVKFAIVHVGAAQLVYLLGFSYAFFFPGWTGLTIVIGAVATLFVLMQVTGKVDWSKVFDRSNSQAALPVAPPPIKPAPDTDAG